MNPSLQADLSAARDTVPVAPPAQAPGPDFRAVYELRFGDVCRWLRALGIPDGDREDVAQEVFLVVRRKLADFDGRNLDGWLYRITANTASDQRRRAWWRNLFRGSTAAAPVDAPTHSLGPADAMAREEDRRLAWRLIDRLGQKHRVVVALYEIEGYSISEIASFLGVPPATVKTRLHYGRERLMQFARELPPEGPAGRGRP